MMQQQEGIETEMQIGYNIFSMRHKETNEEKFFGRFYLKDAPGLMRAIELVLNILEPQGPFESGEVAEIEMEKLLLRVDAICENFLILMGAKDIQKSTHSMTGKPQ